MTRRDLNNAALIALASVAAYIGLMFGDDIARFRRMSAALAEAETCDTAASCAQAWREIDAAKKR